MKKFFFKPFGAILLTILLIFSAVWLGARSSLLALQNTALTYFHSGDKNGKGIQYDLDRILEETYNLNKLLSRYLPESDENLKASVAAREALKNATTIPGKYERLQELSAAVDNLYNATADIQMRNKNDENNRKGFYSNIRSEGLIIGKSPYNEQARKVNQAMEDFPASLLRRITFVKPMEVFQ